MSSVMELYYADEDAMLEELKKYGVEGSDVLTESTLLRGKRRGNRKVNAKLAGITFDPNDLPNEIVEAATYYAVAKVLDILNEHKENRKFTATQNDKDADDILKGYLTLNKDQDVESTPLIVSVIHGEDDTE